MSQGHGELRVCPHCGSDQAEPELGRDGQQYWRTIMVEIPEVYDGGLYFQCPDCHGRWHRFGQGHRLRTAAEAYVSGRR